MEETCHIIVQVLEFPKCISRAPYFCTSLFQDMSGLILHVIVRLPTVILAHDNQRCQESSASCHGSGASVDMREAAQWGIRQPWKSLLFCWSVLLFLFIYVFNFDQLCFGVQVTLLKRNSASFVDELAMRVLYHRDVNFVRQ